MSNKTPATGLYVKVFCPECERHHKVLIADLETFQCDHKDGDLDQRTGHVCDACGSIIITDRIYNPYNYCDDCMRSRGKPMDPTALKLETIKKSVFIDRDGKVHQWGDD